VTHVAVALFDERDRILCVRQSYRARLWSLPGGGVDEGESPVTAAIRETQEEAGFLVRIDHHVGIYGTDRPNAISLCFRAQLLEAGEWTPGAEIVDRAWFARVRFPPELSPRMRQRIADAFAGERDPIRFP
jgi:8-oxo-dGTP pyrophosphatase MutT (NUDIX family)